MKGPRNKNEASNGFLFFVVLGLQSVLLAVAKTNPFRSASTFWSTIFVDMVAINPRY